MEALARKVAEMKFKHVIIISTCILIVISLYRPVGIIPRSGDEWVSIALFREHEGKSSVIEVVDYNESAIIEILRENNMRRTFLMPKVLTRSDYRFYMIVYTSNGFYVLWLGDRGFCSGDGEKKYRIINSANLVEEILAYINE